MNEPKNSYITLPNGEFFQAGSLIASPKGLQYVVAGLLAPSGNCSDPLIIMEPVEKIAGDPDIPQGEMLSAMGEWSVLTLNSATDPDA